MSAGVKVAETSRDPSAVTSTSQRRHLRICPAVLFKNPHNVFGNGDRHDGKRDGENCLFEDAHAENGSMASRRSLAKLSSLHGQPCGFLGRACVPTRLCANSGHSLSTTARISSE